jgi:glutathione S-transferase
MLTLHHAPRSRSSRIVWLLEELGAPYELKITNIPRQDGTGAADAANPHPDKKVPALVHEGTAITESVAIIQYLTDLFPQAGLAPKIGEPQRGAYLTWLAYYAGVIEPLVVMNLAELSEHPGLKRTFTSLDAVNHRLLEAISAGPYLLGERFSAVDILITSLGQFARQMLSKDPAIDEYLKRCASRPALARAMARDEGK